MIAQGLLSLASQTIALAAGVTDAGKLPMNKPQWSFAEIDCICGHFDAQFRIVRLCSACTCVFFEVLFPPRNDPDQVPTAVKLYDRHSPV